MALFFKLFVAIHLLLVFAANAAPHINNTKSDYKLDQGDRPSNDGIRSHRIWYKTYKPFQLPQRTLNLSIEVDGNDQDGISRVPFRSERIRALETLGTGHGFQFRDELDQDLFYFRMKQEGKLKMDQLSRTTIPAVVKKSAPTQTGKTLVFFDLNFAPAEIDAARDAARARGDSLIVVPERTDGQQKNIERVYRENIALQSKFDACMNNNRSVNLESKSILESELDSDSDCVKILRQYDESNKKVEAAVGQVKPVESIEVVFSDLQRRGIHPSVLIFSGHSGGTGGNISGIFGHTNLIELTEVFAKYPELISSVQSILLWGCYTGTLHSLALEWRKSFPTIKSFVGYRNRAPLGIRPSSGQLMKNYLLAEAELLALKNPKELYHRFKNLDMVADLDATMLKDNIYLSYDKFANVDELFQICDEFDPKLLEKFICYNEALEGCEHPPANHLGPLRELYSYLQINRHCGDALLAKYPKLPSADIVVRLIYLDNIKRNFQQLHQQEFATFNTLFSTLNLSVAPPKIETFFGSKRKSDIANFPLLTEGLFKLRLDNDAFVSNPQWKTILKLNNATFALRLIVYRFWVDYLPAEFEHCVPFSWVEPGSKELDKCNFGSWFKEPLSLKSEFSLWDVYYASLLQQWIRNEGQSNITFYLGINWKDLPSLSKDYLVNLDSLIKELEGNKSRSLSQESELRRYQQTKSQLSNATDQQVAEFLLGELKALEHKVLELKEHAHQNPKGLHAERSMELIAKQSSESQTKIRNLINPPNEPSAEYLSPATLKDGSAAFVAESFFLAMEYLHSWALNAANTQYHCPDVIVQVAL